MSTKTKTKIENDPCAFVEVSIPVKLSGYLVNNYDELVKLYSKLYPEFTFGKLPNKFPVFIEEDDNASLNSLFADEHFHYDFKI